MRRSTREEANPNAPMRELEVNGQPLGYEPLVEGRDGGLPLARVGLDGDHHGFASRSLKAATAGSHSRV